MPDPLSMLCTYWPKSGSEEVLRVMLLKHGPALRSVGLITDAPVTIWKAKAKGGSVRFVERFDWIDHNSPNIAHQLPEVMQVWEPMGELCEKMDFSVIEPVADGT